MIYQTDKRNVTNIFQSRFLLYEFRSPSLLKSVFFLQSYHLQVLFHSNLLSEKNLTFLRKSTLLKIELRSTIYSIDHAMTGYSI